MCFEPTASGRTGALLQVLVVEDQMLIAEDLAQTVLELGAAVVGIAATAEEAIRIAAERRPDVVLIDIRLRGIEDGIDAARGIREMSNPAIIFCTGNGDYSTRRRIDAFGNAQLLLKPVDSAELAQAIGQSRSDWRREGQN
jgi:DNA-binding NarL/FixJ family response regulator